MCLKVQEQNEFLLASPNSSKHFSPHFSLPLPIDDETENV